jgi:endonuclease III
MDIKNIPNPEGFIPRLAIDLLNSRPEEELWAQFEEDYKEEIENLFFNYIEEMALAMAKEKYPVLKMDIADTDLPEKVKAKLQEYPAMITKVEDLVKYTEAELKKLPGITPKTVEAIKEFFAKNGIGIC